MDIASLGQQFGLSPQQTQAAFEALAPVVAAGMRRNTGNDGGLSDLIGALGGGTHARYAEDTSALGSPQADGQGGLGDILGQVLGGGTAKGNAADELLNSVSEALRRR